MIEPLTLSDGMWKPLSASSVMTALLLSTSALEASSVMNDAGFGAAAGVMVGSESVAVVSSATCREGLEL